MTRWVLVALLLALVAAAAVGVALAVRAARRRRRVAPAPGEVPRLPVVLVHGLLGFTEVAGQAYFRGIADHLSRRGARVHAPRLPALSSVPERAEALAAFVRALPDPRVHLVAHSMGGLDARWAIAHLGLAERVASLTTIATPHRGTPLAEIKDLAPLAALRAAAARLGLATDALDWLTPARMERFHEEAPDDPRVLYASVVCAARRQISPLLRPTHAWLRRRAGESDGLVPAASQPWGEVVLEVEADHWAQVGWSTRFDATGLYDAILRVLAARGL